jgi:hypothetical protein
MYNPIFCFMKFSARAPMAAAVDMGNQMPGMSNNQMFGGPQMWQQQQYMMMQQQAAMSQMMQMQVDKFLQFDMFVTTFSRWNDISCRHFSLQTFLEPQGDDARKYAQRGISFSSKFRKGDNKNSCCLYL